jgi:hypothetical protein
MHATDPLRHARTHCSAPPTHFHPTWSMLASGHTTRAQRLPPDLTDWPARRRDALPVGAADTTRAQRWPCRRSQCVARAALNRSERRKHHMGRNHPP